ncbi:4487_t:CDS:1, partial [Acaulospora colombiana]
PEKRKREDDEESAFLFKAPRGIAITHPREVEYLINTTFSLHKQRYDMHRDILRKASGKSAVAVVQELSHYQRFFDGIEPIPIDSPVWGHVSKCAEAMLELAQSPGRFRAAHWINQGVLKKRTRKAPKDRNTYQELYTRIYKPGRHRYRQLLQEYVSQFPSDLSWALFHGGIYGIGDIVLEKVKDILDKAGYSNIHIPSLLQETEEEPVFVYSGTTAYDNYSRFLEQFDSEESSRQINFTSLTEEDDWDHYEWIPLQDSITSTLNFRTDPILGFKESTLIDMCPQSTNSGPGGFVSKVAVESRYHKAIKLAMDMAPRSLTHQPASTGLKDDLRLMLRGEIELLAKLRQRID